MGGRVSQCGRREIHRQIYCENLKRPKHIWEENNESGF